MDTVTPQTGEGRIIAQRKILSLILARLAGSDPDLLASLEPQTLFSGHEEDPGVEPSPEYALEAEIADEIRLILEGVRRRLG